MVIFLGLAAAVLYGGGDFLGGMATRKAHVLAVLTVVETANYLRDAAKSLTDENRQAVVDLIASDPECGALLRAAAACAKFASRWPAEISVAGLE